PADGLSPGRLVPDVIRVLDRRQFRSARVAGRGQVAAVTEQRLHLDETAADGLIQLFPARRLRPIRIGLPHTPEGRVPRSLIGRCVCDGDDTAAEERDQSCTCDYVSALHRRLPPCTEIVVPSSSGVQKTKLNYTTVTLERDRRRRYRRKLESRDQTSRVVVAGGIAGDVNHAIEQRVRPGRRFCPHRTLLTQKHIVHGEAELDRV